MKHPDLDYSNSKIFTSRERTSLYCSSHALSGILKALLSTCRARVVNEDVERQVVAEHKCFLGACWHETIVQAIGCYRGRGFHTLTSCSFDGELAARVATCFGIYALRGSSSRGGHDALAKLEKAANLARTVVLTIDGPRGPRRCAKAGIAVLSARTGIPIVPMAFGARRVWRLGSWDKMVVPKPFSAIVCVLGEPIPPPPDVSRDAVEVTRLRVETELNALHEELEDKALSL